MARKFGIGVFEVKSWSRDILGFDFSPHSIIPVT